MFVPHAASFVSLRQLALCLAGMASVTFAPSITIAQNGADQSQTSGNTSTQLIKSLPDDPSTVIAYVGRSPVLLGELMPKVEARIAAVEAKAGQKVKGEQRELAKVNLVRGLLAQTIQNKVMREAFLLDQVSTAAADKRAEADERLSARSRQMFFESELPSLKKKYKTEDISELDNKLRLEGSSLIARQNEFADTMLGHLYIRDKVTQKPDVTLSEIYEHFQENKADYSHKARAKWEQMTVLFANFATREQAQAAIAEMGREAFFGGNVQAVARSKSQGPFASSGGLHDWTNRGSLASEDLEQQIYSIPLNKLSEIIEDSDGLHIIRVLERQDAGIATVAEVQDDIKKTIQQQKRSKEQREVLAGLSDRVPVWSIFPDDAPGALPLSIATGQPSTLR